MARARNIKPSFFTNDDLAEIPALGRLLFIGLWTIADRSGRLEDRPKKIRAEVLPYDECDVDELLEALQERGFILRYVVGESNYIQILTFEKHQNPHVKEAASSIPAPDKHSASTVQDTTLTGTSPADSLLLIPDSIVHTTNADDAPHRVSKSSKPDQVKALMDLGVKEQHAIDWLKVRAKKRAPAISPSVMEAIEREAASAGMSLPEVIRICAEREWQGFKASWLQDKNQKQGRANGGALASGVVI